MYPLEALLIPLHPIERVTISTKTSFCKPFGVNVFGNACEYVVSSVEIFKQRHRDVDSIVFMVRGIAHIIALGDSYSSVSKRCRPSEYTLYAEQLLDCSIV